MDFEWDLTKAKNNLKKHQISFEEAITIFDDPLAITIDDPLHSNEENRFIDIGYSTQRRILVVVYTERGTKIRIISRRRATYAEQKIYEESNI